MSRGSKLRANALDGVPIAPRRADRVVRCYCPKCHRYFDHTYIKGMRKNAVHGYIVWCYSCNQIRGQVHSSSGRDVTGQLFLPLYPCQG